MTQIIDLGKLRFNFAGDYSVSTQYESNDVVIYGGVSYVYTNVTKAAGHLPTETAYWAKVADGVRPRGDWATATEYFVNDIVIHGGAAYISVLRSTSGVFNDDLAANKWVVFSGGTRWRSAWTTATSYLKNDIVKDAVGSAYIATTDHTSNSSFTTDKDAGKWAIFVVGGADVLPATVGSDVGKSLMLNPTGTAIDWIGATESTNVFYVAPGGIDGPNYGKNISAPFASVRYACDHAPAGSTIFVKTGTYNEQLPITVPANTAIVGDNQRTVVIQPASGNSDDGVTPNNQASMFLMSNGSILNKMTFKGMTGWVPGTTAADVTTSTIKGVVVRFNPASPITTKSPYVLECAFIGAGAIGALIDGSIHSTGAKTMIFHGYTCISDNGVGYWVKDGGKAEIVSCFTYYCYFGYTASGGGFIRALNGNNSYGTWGATARGYDAGETPATGALYGQQLNFLYQGGNVNIGDTVTGSGGGTAIVTNVQTTANKVYVRNATGSFTLGDTLTFTGGGTGTVSAGALENQKGFILVMNNLTAAPIPGQSISITGDSYAYVIQSIQGTWVNTTSVVAVVLAQEKPSGSANGTVTTLRSMYSQVRLTGHDFLSIGTGGVTTTNYPGTPTQPAAQGNEVDEAYPGRVYYVSTDQNGNFRVGEYFRIDQATGRATLNASAFDLAGLTSLRLGSIGAQLGETINEFSSDGTLSGNSNVAVPTEQATKTYVDNYALPTKTFSNGGILATDGVSTFWDSPTQIAGQNTFSIVSGATFADVSFTATSLVNASPTFVWSVRYDTLPAGITSITMAPSSGTLSMAGTFTSSGSYQFTVEATDGKYVGSFLIRIYVAATAVIPVFTTTANAVSSVGVPNSSMTVTALQATNTGGGITYAVVNGGYPSWLTFNTSTGAFSGTTPAGENPTRKYTITISATAGGVTVLKTFKWSISSVSPSGQVSYTTAGTFSWVAPAGVNSVCVVAVGAGGSGVDGSSGYSGGGGGGLGWKNNIPVVPGQSYTVVVAPTTPKGTMAGNSYFISLATVAGYGGGRGYPASAGSYNTNGPNQNGSSYSAGGGWQGTGGGAGGQCPSSSLSGGGAAGYTGNGGDYSQLPPSDNGGAAGGGRYSSTYGWGAGGGVGLNGKGVTATGWYHGSSGQYYTTSPGNGGGGMGGSGGTNGMSGENPSTSTGQGGNGGLYGGVYGGGGGGCGDGWPGNGGIGGQGGVRIIWGPGRSYPLNAS